MQARKLFLTVLAGGPMLGVLAGTAVDPTMLPAPEPSWRKMKPDVIFTGAGQSFHEAGPEDLSPLSWSNLRSSLLARRFAADAEPPPYRLQLPEYKVEQPALLVEHQPDQAESETALAAEAGDGAAMAAGDDAGAAGVAASDVGTALATDGSPEAPVLPEGTEATADF